MSHKLIVQFLTIGVIGLIGGAGDGGTMPLAAQAKAPAAARAQPPATTTTAPPTITPSGFGIGRPATPTEIAAWDIDVRPDGTGLPPGRGTSAEGQSIYAARCAVCHGKTGKEGPNDILVGREPRAGFPFSRDPTLPRTIGNYWPYATTVFDYVRRAMPPDAPGSLRDNDVYGIVAYLLFLNELIPADAVIDDSSLPKVVMPAHDRFVPDTRGGSTSATGAPRRR